VLRTDSVVESNVNNGLVAICYAAFDQGSTIVYALITSHITPTIDPHHHWCLLAIISPVEDLLRGEHIKEQAIFGGPRIKWERGIRNGRRIGWTSIRYTRQIVFSKRGCDVNLPIRNCLRTNSTRMAILDLRHRLRRKWGPKSPLPYRRRRIPNVAEVIDARLLGTNQMVSPAITDLGSLFFGYQLTSEIAWCLSYPKSTMGSAELLVGAASMQDHPTKRTSHWTLENMVFSKRAIIMKI